MRKTIVIGLFAAGAAALAYVALIGDPAVPLGPPETAELVVLDMPDNQGPDRLKPTGRWIALTTGGERIAGRSLRLADLALGDTVCVQRYRREWSGEVSASVLSSGACGRTE